MRKAHELPFKILSVYSQHGCIGKRLNVHVNYVLKHHPSCHNMDALEKNLNVTNNLGKGPTKACKPIIGCTCAWRFVHGDSWTKIAFHSQSDMIAPHAV